MKIAIACDHAGLPLKQFLLNELKDAEIIDLGVQTTDSVDYPDYAKLVCEAVLKGKADFGVLVCGSGIGMSMAANRFKGIRAALCWDLISARLSREHNNANVLCLGARLLPLNYGAEIAKLWLKTPFMGKQHERRIQKLDH